MGSSGGTKGPIIRSSLRNQSIASQISTLVVGIVIPAVLLGYSGLVFLGSGFTSGAAFPLAFGISFALATLVDILPQTITLGEHEIVRQSIWTKTSIALADVRAVAVARGKRHLVAIRSKGGTLIVAGNGFSDADMALLVTFLRARLTAGATFEQFSEIPFGWGAETEDDDQQHKERRFRLGLRIMVGLGFVFVFGLIGKATLAFWSEVDFAVGGFMLLILASFVLMAVEIVTGRRRYLVHGILLMGLAMLFVAGYPVFAEMVGAPTELSLGWPANLVLVAGGVLVLFFYERESRIPRPRGEEPKDPASGEIHFTRTPTGILSLILITGIALSAVLQGASDFASAVRWGYVAASFGSLIWFFGASQRAVQQGAQTPFPAVFLRAERILAVTGSLGLPIGAWQFLALGSPGPAIWCVSAGLFLVIWLFRALPKARPLVAVSSLYGLAVGAAAAWYAHQAWDLSWTSGYTIGGFLAIAIVAVGMEIAWDRSRYEP